MSAPPPPCCERCPAPATSRSSALAKAAGTLLAFAALLAPLPAAAQTSITLISNTGEASTEVGSLVVGDLAQAFTTGADADGYTLTGVDINFAVVDQHCSRWQCPSCVHLDRRQRDSGHLCRRPHLSVHPHCQRTEFLHHNRYRPRGQHDLLCGCGQPWRRCCKPTAIHRERQRGFGRPVRLEHFRCQRV